MAAVTTPSSHRRGRQLVRLQRGRCSMAAVTAFVQHHGLFETVQLQRGRCSMAAVTGRMAPRPRR